MSEISKKIIYLLKVIISMAISLGVLSLFTYVYLYDGVHIENRTSATDYKWEPNQYKATMEEGYSWFRMDENGFNNAYDSSENIDILLMGSSHMEAGNLPPEANVGYKLNELIPDMYTYNIGISGHTIYNCVNNIENAVNLYMPQKYVVLETSAVELSVDSMTSVLEGKFERHPSYDEGVLYWVQKNIPAAKMFYKKLEEWRSYDVKTESIPNASLKSSQINQEYPELVSEFLKKAAEPVKSKECELIIFYHPDTGIDKNGKWKDVEDTHYLEIFKEACAKNDIKFIDMTQEFKRLYEEEHVLAHGFINGAVGEGHLNKFGHAIIAERLAIEIL